MINNDIFNLINFLSSNWVIIISFISILVILVGQIFYEISIFQPLIDKQENYRKQKELQEFENRMIIRHLKLGNSFLDVYKLEAAKTEFEKALNLDQKNIEAHMGLIKSEVFEPILKKDAAHYDPEIAESKLNLILEENPDDKHALLFLGKVYTTINNNKALEYLDKALVSDPKLAVAYSAKAYVYATQKKTMASKGLLSKKVNFNQ
jgi:tetratricopeptide (TPR) repeat protein